MSEQMEAALALACPEEVQHVPRRNMGICNYCLNRNKLECETECQPEGTYRYLEPEPLPHWELPPSLPPYRVVADMRLADVLAALWLHAYYLEPGNDPR